MNESGEQNKFIIVDLDRTLVDSDKLLEIFIEISNEFIQIPKEQIEAADRDVKLRGDSFDTAGFVRDFLNASGQIELWDKLTKKFISESRHLNYLLPGAAELLDYLNNGGHKYGILTYGNPLWQHLKLSASGFNHVPRIVMEQKEKGRLIRSWQDGDKFVIPEEFGGGTYDSVILLDDKAVSFAEFPDSPSRGIWVLDPDSELPSQQGEVPENVHRVHSLAGVVELL